MVASPTSMRVNAVQIARQKLLEQPVYIDTETTGIERSDEIVEIAIIDHNGKTLLDSLVRPTRPIPPDASRVHGISDEMVQKAPTWPVLWPTIRSMLVGHVVATYNADFDLRLMQQSHARYRLPWKENFNMFCIMKLYASYRGEWDANRRSYRWHTLDNAGKQCGIALPNSHRAVADTLLAKALLEFMARTEIPG